jgi:uncharacterized protein YndB with AHSA1/START domain
MKTSLLVDFSVDKENKTIYVKREFAAPLASVWAAWTQSNLLDQWWAPKPWKARTKTLDFREGGYWLYAMVGPDSPEQWCRADFSEIEQLKYFSCVSRFCDENGNINQSFPRMLWRSEFNETSDATMVDIEVSFDEYADLEKYIEMGFKEGFLAAMENLDEMFG